MNNIYNLSLHANKILYPNGILYNNDNYVIQYVGNPLFNKVLYVKQNLMDVYNIIDTWPSCTWYIWNDDLEQSTYLKTKKFVYTGLSYFMMLKECKHIDVGYNAPIKKVESIDEVILFSDLFLDGYGLFKNNFIIKHANEFFMYVFNNALLDLYIGYYNNTPCFTTSISLTSNSIGVCNVSTIEKFRHHGVCTFNLIQILKKYGSYNLPYTLLSTPSSENIYQKLGFEKYDKIEVWFKRK